MIKLKNLLKESSPGFENRQVGDALPTLDSVRTAYQAKKALEEGESFTAVNKDSGETSVFKSKASRDSAIKKGTHDKKAAKGGDSSAGKEVPKVNIFDKPKEEPKSDKSSEPDYDKYNNKSQTMTDFFKGDLSIDDLQKVAKKNFDSEIASEKDLDGFLNNKLSLIHI